MDPYIDAGKLDPGHPLHAAKIDNLRRGDRAHRDRREEVDALPVKLTLQTTDTCNLDCPHCQIPRAEKIPRMDAAVFERVVAELFPTLIELHPTNLGEPLTWPLFERLCAEMDRHGVLLDLTTNGTLLHGARSQEISPAESFTIPPSIGLASASRVALLATSNARAPSTSRNGPTRGRSPITSAVSPSRRGISIDALPRRRHGERDARW